MKNQILLLALTLALAVTGCRTPTPTGGAGGTPPPPTQPILTPAVLRVAVATGAGFAMLRKTNAIPGVVAATEVICAQAHGTNISPRAIVALLDAAGQRTPESTLIVMSAINIYTLTWNSAALQTNGPPVNMNPYALAMCYGLQDAALFVYVPDGSRNAPPSRPVPVWPDAAARLDWPQLK